MSGADVQMKAYQFLCGSIDYVQKAKESNGADSCPCETVERALIAPPAHIMASVLADEFNVLLVDAVHPEGASTLSPADVLFPPMHTQQGMSTFWEWVQRLAAKGSLHAQMLVDKICLELTGPYALFSVWHLCHSGLTSLRSLLGGDKLNLCLLTEQLQLLQLHLQRSQYTCSTSNAIMADMFTWLLEAGDGTFTVGAEVATSLLDIIADECWCHLSRGSFPNTSKSQQPPASSVGLVHLLRAEQIQTEVVKRFCLRRLRRFIPTTELQDVKCAFTSHEKYSLAKGPSKVVSFLRELLVPLSSEEVLAFLVDHCDRIAGVAHWPAILTCLSIAVVYKTGFSALLQAMCSKEIVASLQQCNTVVFHVTMLLARHAGLAGTDVFPSYTEWFRLHLSGAVTPLPSTHRGMQFFFQCLSSTVPHESLEGLKVHCAGVQVDGKFRQLYFDFIQLSKTRRNDLVAKQEASSQHAGSQSNPVQARIAGDVEDAVRVFATSGVISKKILKSSVFERPYYKGQFLPALLSPKSIEEVSDAREKFIAKLTSVGKAQQNAVALYKSACQSLLTKEDTSLGKLTVGDLQRKLSEILLSGEDIRNHQLLTDIVQQLSAKLAPKNFDLYPVWSLNVTRPCLHVGAIEVVDCVLQHFGDALKTETNASGMFRPALSVSQQSTRLFKVFSSSRFFQFAFYIRLQDFLEHGMALADEVLLRCLALCLVTIHMLGERWLHVGAYERLARSPREVQFCQQHGGCLAELSSVPAEFLELVLLQSTKEDSTPVLRENCLRLIDLVHQLAAASSAQLPDVCMQDQSSHL